MKKVLMDVFATIGCTVIVLFLGFCILNIIVLITLIFNILLTNTQVLILFGIVMFTFINIIEMLKEY